MKRQHRIIGGLAGLSLAMALAIPSAAMAAPLPASAAAATAAPAAACTDGRWPASVQGQPTQFRAGARAADYIWHDASGWHVRVTHPGHGRAVFTGTVVASAPMKVTPVLLEKGDWVRLSADRRVITYRLANYGRIDGFNFTTACARQITFSGRLDGWRLSTGRIVIGRSDRHPLQNPFAVRRVL